MTRVQKWKPGQPVPDYYSGMSVTFAWNDVALTKLLGALRDQYPTGYASMVDHVRAAMESFTPPTPPKPDEPTGLGAVVEDAEGVRWVRAPKGAWHAADNYGSFVGGYSLLDAVRILSPGVEVDQ